MFVVVVAADLAAVALTGAFTTTGVVAPATGVAAVSELDASVAPDVVAAAVTALVVADVAGTAIDVNPPAPPAPLVTTGTGSELIELFTVSCGFAVADGGIT